MPVLSEGRNTWQRVWETKVNSTVQNDPETITKDYVTDYTSVANRDIFVYEHGSYTQKYVYGINGDRLWAEFDYAEETKPGEPGENLASDFASVDIQKIWYRRNLTESTLFAVDENDEVINHVMYDDWGKPLTDLPLNQNYAGIDNINNYAGYTYDEVLELYFVQNRFYNADTRQFTQEDPIKDGANWYAYCEGNPLVRVDWYGLEVALVQIRNSSLKHNVNTNNADSVVEMLNLHSRAQKSGKSIVVYNYNAKNTVVLEERAWKGASVTVLLQKTGFKLADSKHKMAQGYFQKVQCQGKQNEYIINMFEYGSDAYLNMVEGLIQYNHRARVIYGKAIERVMRDVNAYQGQISSPNFKKLGQRFAEYVGKAGVIMSPEIHYFRNKLNRAPATLDEMVEINRNITDEKSRWILLSTDNSAYHMYATDFSGDGLNNLKFISADGMYEAVYNHKGQLCTEITDPINMGTFNYDGTYATDPWEGGPNHGSLDVAPYYLWGNVPNGGKAPHSYKENKERYKNNTEAHQKRKEFIVKEWIGQLEDSDELRAREAARRGA